MASDSSLPSRTPQDMPTHAEVYRILFSSTLINPLPNDIDPIYHSPSSRHAISELTRSNTVVLSISPTPGFYAALRPQPPLKPLNPICFLHRPWTLDRRALPRSAVVLASHTSFDAHLTVGWNPILARRLGFPVNSPGPVAGPESSGDPDAPVDSQSYVCLKGYKGDPERKIGLIVRAQKPSTPHLLPDLLSRVRAEYPRGTLQMFEHGADEGMIKVLAIMNAFGREEVERVAGAASDAGWVMSAAEVLYLTGQARDPGVEAARQVGMPVVCVGHRGCEEWGVQVLAESVKERYPCLKVQVVLEEEEVAPPRQNQGRAANRLPPGTNTMSDAGT